MNGRVSRLHGPWWWPALLALSLLLLAAPGALAMPAPPSLPAPPYALYARLSVAPEYVPLDPATLADSKVAQPLELDGAWPALLLSANGATLVAIEHHTDTPDTVVIRDGLHGPERLRFTLTFGVDQSWISPAGDLLAVSSYLSSGIQLWQVFDTHTGRLVAAIPCRAQEAAPDLIDPDGHRLYHPFYDAPATQPSSDESAPKGPWQLWIAAYDMTTGQETGRVAVPGVMTGAWPRGDIQGDPIMQMVQPAIALSPDGTRLAIIDADSTKVTLVDTKTLSVAGSHALHRPESAVHQFLRWLGLAPQTAEAKFMAGHQLSAVFAPDGQHLYLSGIETSVDTAKKTMTGKSLGMRRIDVTTGAITATALADSQVATVLPSPDGRSLYVSGPATSFWENQTGQETWVLRRLDARTLTPLAKRTFDSPPYLVILPANQHG